MRSRLLISFFVVFFMATLSSPGQGQQASGEPVTSAKPEPLTNLPKSVLDAELRAARGGSFRLSDRSGKVLVITLWATWCTPCLRQISSLVKLQEQFRAEGVDVIGLSTEDPEASAKAITEFARDSEVNFEIGWATSKVATALMQGRDAIPQSFVISRSGRLVKRFVGFNPEHTPPLLEQAIRDALNNQGEPPGPD